MQETNGRQQQRIEATRNTILDAAVDLYQRQGVAQTTISQVIKQSGLGRTTFYRYFKDQDDVLNHAVLRDFDILMEDFEQQRFQHERPDVQIVEDMAWFNRQLRQRPALALLFGDQGRSLFRKLDLSLETFKKVGLACSRPTFELAQQQGVLRQGIDLEKYVEWSYFILISLQSNRYPFTDNEFSLRELLRDFLVPSLIIVRQDQEIRDHQ